MTPCDCRKKKIPKWSEIFPIFESTNDEIINIIIRYSSALNPFHRPCGWNSWIFSPSLPMERGFRRPHWLTVQSHYSLTFPVTERELLAHLRTILILPQRSIIPYFVNSWKMCARIMNWWDRWKVTFSQSIQMCEMRKKTVEEEAELVTCIMLHNECVKKQGKVLSVHHGRSSA